jgi:hypothetical protein
MLSKERRLPRDLDIKPEKVKPDANLSEHIQSGKT